MVDGQRRFEGDAQDPGDEFGAMDMTRGQGPADGGQAGHGDDQGCAGRHGGFVGGGRFQQAAARAVRFHDQDVRARFA